MTKFSDASVDCSNRRGQDPLCVYKILDTRLPDPSVGMLKTKIITLLPS